MFAVVADSWLHHMIAWNSTASFNDIRNQTFHQPMLTVLVFLIVE